MPTEEVSDQSFEDILPEEKPLKEERFLTFGKFKIKLKTALIGLGGFLGLLILVIPLLNQSLNRRPSLLPSPSPSPSPTPIKEEITSPSIYATDSAVLKIEAELKTIESKLQSTDLREKGLNPPVLDMDVNFEE